MSQKLKGVKLLGFQMSFGWPPEHHQQTTNDCFFSLKGKVQVTCALADVQNPSEEEKSSVPKGKCKVSIDFH